MQFWDKHWYGAVAAIRPYLFQKCLLLVVAVDLLVLMVERGGRYGLDAIPFNVPHFPWLNGFHRLFLTNGVPDATYYVAIVVVTSFLSFCLVLGGHRAWLTAIVTALYTYAWSMSRLDGYLHHYMLSLILFCMIFFPRVDSRILREWCLKESPRTKNASTEYGLLAGLLISLACVYRISLTQSMALTAPQRWISMFVCCGVLIAIVIRWSRSQFSDTSLATVPTISAWAVRLLGTTVGVIYVFTSIAKMDMEWCGGYTLQQVGTTADVLLPIEQLATSVGISKDWFWAGLATFVIPLELTLAAVYLVSVRQDEPNRRWLPHICFVGWLLAVGLHLNNEMMNLIIQWFGYYMLMLATICLLPARILMILGTAFYWPEAWVQDKYDAALSKMTNGQAAAVLGFVSMIALVTVVYFGFFTSIMGAIFASIFLAAFVVLLLVLGLVAGWERKSIRISLATLLASVMMTVVVAQCSMRFDYYDMRGKTLQNLGKHEPAIRELELAIAFPASRKSKAEAFTNLALSYRRTGDTQKAERYFRKAIESYPQQFLAHYSLGNLLISQQRTDRAEQHYRQTIAIKPDFSDAYVNLGNILEFKNQIQEAIECYEVAASIEKEAVDIQRMIESAKAKLKTTTTPSTN